MNIPTESTAAEREAAALLEEGIACVRQALARLRFGQVSITVHEGRVVQLDVTEKRRLRPQ